MANQCIDDRVLRGIHDLYVFERRESTDATTPHVGDHALNDFLMDNDGINWTQRYSNYKMAY